MAIQTRGQITLLSKPDVTISMTPELITIPVNSNGELIDSLSFTETIAIQAKDSKGRTLYFESISVDETGKSKDWRSQEELVKEGLLEIIQEDETSQIIGYRYSFKRTKEQVKEELNPTSFINFGFRMENKLDIADDDFSDYRTISYIKAKSGQDGTPAYSVDIAGEQQVFIRTINPDGTYSYEPETITLTAVPINFEGSSFEPYYKWFKYGKEEDILLQGQGKGVNELKIFPNTEGYGVGVYVCEIYRSFSGEIENSPVARDYASIGMATNGIDNYTVSLTNDNAVVTVDNLQHALEGGVVSTGVVVYKGANKINPNDYFIEIENEKDGEVEFSAILNTKDSNNPFWEVQADYKKGEYVGAIGEFIVKVGGMEFKKRFQVSPSLMGGTSRLIKISGQQYFRINQDGNSYTPNDITLTAHLSNVEFLRWEYQNPENKEEWPTIADASLSLDVNFNDVYWQKDNLAKFRAVATAENIEYYDEYTVYKFKEGQNSINVIASNESVNIITDVFGKIDPSIDNTIETIYFTVFNGADASTDIKIPEDKIEITPDVSSMISVSSQSNALKIGITRDDDKVFTPATIKVELSNGATKTISLVPLQQGLSARTLTIYGNQVFKYSNSTTGEVKYDPTEITVHAQYQNIEGYSWYYRIGKGSDQDLLIPGDSYSFAPSNFSEWLPDQILTIGVKEKNPPIDSTAIADEITIHQVYDGSNGKDSSLVFLNNPSITVTEDSEGKLVGETFECEVLGVTGTENVTPTGISWSDTPSWMTITLSETKLQLKVSDDISTSDIQNRQGSITIYTTTPVNASLQLHWTIVKNGRDGQNGVNYALVPSQAVLRKDANSGISPSELTFSATIKEGSGLAKPLIGYIECYSSTDGEDFNSNPIQTSTGSSLTISADASWAAIKGKLYEDLSKEVLLDEQTVIVIESSSASFVASLDNEYIPVVCDADGNILDNDANLGTCKITAYLNGVEITDYSTNLSISVVEGSGDISYTSSIEDGSITIKDLKTDKAKIKFTVTQTINNILTKIDKYLKVEKIKGGKDAPETETLIHYQASNSGTSVPTGTWYPSISNTGIQQGQFLWTRTTLHYKNGEKEDIISYSVSRYGLDGEPGKTMTRVENYYAASTSSSIAPTSGWKTDPMETTFSSVNKYLWNYEKIYSNNTLLSTTDPTVISVYGDTGATIASITETYKASKSDQSHDYPNSFTFNFVSTVAESGFNSVYKYLWNIETFYDKDGNLLAQSPARVIGVYGGKDGKTIVSITTYYAVNNSSSTSPTVPELKDFPGVWKLNIDNNDFKNPNHYIWALDYFTYDDGSHGIAEKARLDLGVRSDKVAQGLYDGTFNLGELTNAKMTSATLNKNTGLLIEGINDDEDTYKLEANSHSLGIYRNNDLKFGTYTDNEGQASIIVKGTIYADRGKIGTLQDTDDKGKKIGWTILGSEKDKTTGVYSPAAIYSGDRSSLNSTAEGVYIGTDGLNFGANEQTNLKFIYEDENIDDNTTKKVGKLTIQGNITADTLTVRESIKAKDVEGFDKSSLRTTIGIFSGNNESVSLNAAQNGDLFVKFSSGSADTTTTPISVSSTSGALNPGKERFFTASTLNGLRKNWNGWADSQHSGGGTNSSYMKVGRLDDTWKNGSYRGAITVSITGGNTSINNFTLSFQGNFYPFNTYDSANWENSSGIINVAMYSGNSTTAIAKGTVDITGKNYIGDQTFSVEMNGSISSNNSYYVVMTASIGTLLYIKHGTLSISGSNNLITTVQPEFFIKSNNAWMTIGKGGTNSTISGSFTSLTWEGGVTSSPYPYLSGSNINPIQGEAIPIASSNNYGVVKIGSGLISSSNILTLNATKVDLNGNSLYSNVYIRSSNNGLPSGSNGDICFMY